MRFMICIAAATFLSACGQFPDPDSSHRANVSHSPSSSLFVEKRHRDKWPGVFEYAMEAMRIDRDHTDWELGDSVDHTPPPTPLDD